MKAWIYTLIAIIAVLSLINFLSYKRVMKCNQEIANMQVIKNEFSKEIYVSKIINESLNNNQLIFNSKSVFIQNISGVKSSLYEKEDITQKLFFAFSPIEHCSTCILETILSLKGKFKSPEDVIILVSDSQPEDLSIISQKYNLKFKIYSLTKTDFTNVATGFKKPFLFTLNKELETRCLYFVETDGKFLTDVFLSKVSLQ